MAYISKYQGKDFDEAVTFYKNHTDLDSDISKINSSISEVQKKLEDYDPSDSTAIKEIESEVDALETSISEINKKLENYDPSNNESIKTLKSDVDSVKINVSTNTNDIATLKTDVSANTSNLNTLLNTTIPGINDSIQDLYSKIGNGNVDLTSKVESLESSVNGLETTVNDFINSFSEQAIDEKIQTAIEPIQTSTEENRVSLETLTTSLEDLSKEVEEDKDTQFCIWQGDSEDAPTLNSDPANSWTTGSEKSQHIGDFYITTDGFCYKFINSNGTYKWELVEDRYIVPYANKIETKSRIFTSQPLYSDSYNNGDLWLNAIYKDGDDYIYYKETLVCKESKDSGDEFSIEDWESANITSNGNGSGITTINSKSQLYESATWSNEKGESNIYNGLVASSVEGSLFICIDSSSYQFESSWIELKKTVDWTNIENAPSFASEDHIHSDYESEIETLQTTSSTNTESIQGLETFKNRLMNETEDEGLIPEMQNNISEMQEQLDNQFYIWQGDSSEEPSSTTLPEVEWVTEEEKKSHIGDFYITTEGICYKYSDKYTWDLITDKYTYSYANKIDTKATVFTSVPKLTDSYKVGDLWVGATYKEDNSTTYTFNNDIVICISEKDFETEFSPDDWQVMKKGDDTSLSANSVTIGTNQRITGTKVFVNPLYFGNDSDSDLVSSIYSNSTGFFIEAGKNNSTISGTDLGIKNSTGGALNIVSELKSEFISDNISKSGDILITSTSHGNITVSSGNKKNASKSGGNIILTTPLANSTGNVGVEVDPETKTVSLFNQSGAATHLSDGYVDVSGFNGLSISSQGKTKSNMSGVRFNWSPDTNGDFTNLDIHKATYDSTSRSIIEKSVDITINGGAQVLTTANYEGLIGENKGSSISFNSGYLSNLEGEDASGAVNGTVDVSEYLQKAIDDAIEVGSKLIISHGIYKLDNPVYINATSDIEIEANGSTFICGFNNVEDTTNSIKDFSYEGSSFNESVITSTTSTASSTSVNEIGKSLGSLFIIPGEYKKEGNLISSEEVDLLNGNDFKNFGYINSEGTIVTEDEYEQVTVNDEKVYYSSYIQLDAETNGTTLVVSGKSNSEDYYLINFIKVVYTANEDGGEYSYTTLGSYYSNGTFENEEITIPDYTTPENEMTMYVVILNSTENNMTSVSFKDTGLSITDSISWVNGYYKSDRTYVKNEVGNYKYTDLITIPENTGALVLNEGETETSNDKNIYTISFYNESEEFISNDGNILGNIYDNVSVLLPAGAVSFRVNTLFGSLTTINYKLVSTETGTVTISKPALSTTKTVSLKNAIIKAPEGYRSNTTAFDISRQYSIELEKVTVKNMFTAFSIECCKWGNPKISRCDIENCMIGFDIHNATANFLIESVDILKCNTAFYIDVDNTSHGSNDKFIGGFDNSTITHCSIEGCRRGIYSENKYGMNSVRINCCNFEGNLDSDIVINNYKIFDPIENCKFNDVVNVVSSGDTQIYNVSDWNTLSSIILTLPDGTTDVAYPSELSNVDPAVSGYNTTTKLGNEHTCTWTKNPISFGNKGIYIENNIFYDSKNINIGTSNEGSVISDIIFANNKVYTNIENCVNICSKDTMENKCYNINVYGNSFESDKNINILCPIYSEIEDMNPSGEYMTRYNTTPKTPDSPTTTGNIGDLRWDSNRAYLKTEDGWKVIPFIHTFSQEETDPALAWKPLETRSTAPSDTEGYNVGDFIWNVSGFSNTLGWRLVKLSADGEAEWKTIEDLIKTQIIG